MTDTAKPTQLLESAAYDATLLLSAKNVETETGLTPWQLLEQRDALQERVRELEGQIQSIIECSHSYIDGRFLFEPLLNRKTLDIKKRKDGVDTWYEGDWLSDLGKTIQKAKAALAKHGKV